MADPLEAYLLKSPATNKQRAELWDAFEAAKDEDDLAARIGAISVPNSVKAGLWDMKASAKPAEPAPMAEPTPTPRDPRLTPTMVSAGDPSVALEMLGGIPGGVGNAVVGAVKAPFQVIGANFDRMERGREKALAGDWGGGLMDAVVGSIPGAPTALAMAQGSVDKVSEAGADAGRGSFLSAVQNLGAAVPLAGPMMDDWGKRWAYASPKERGEILGEVLATAAAPKVASEAIAGAPRVIRPIKGLAQESLRRGANFTEAAVPGTASKLRKMATALAPDWSKRAAALWQKVKGVSAAEAEKAAAKMSEAEFKALEAETIKAEKQSTALENKVIRREIADSKKQAAYDRGREARDAHDARQAAKKAPSEPAKAEPKAEATDDLESALKASLKPTDGPVHAPPAFPGQQSAKGATKARFADYTPEAIAKRTMTDVERAAKNVKKWTESNTKPDVIKARLDSIFSKRRSFTIEEVQELIRMAKE